MRYIVRAQRVVLLLSPDPSAALTFTEFRKVLHGWTKPDDVLCVPICALVFERMIWGCYRDDDDSDDDDDDDDEYVYYY